MFAVNCHDGPAGCECSDQGMQPQLDNQNEQYLLNIVHWLERLLPVNCPAIYTCDDGCAPDPTTCITTSTCESSCLGATGPFYCGGSGGLQNITLQSCECICPNGSGTTQIFGCE